VVIDDQDNHADARRQHRGQRNQPAPSRDEQLG